MSDAVTPNRWVRCLLSMFIVLNLSTVLYMNLPREWSAKKYQQWTATWNPMAKYQMSLINWRWQKYAYFTGLNNQWQMFGKQSGSNWWYDIRAVYGKGRAARSVLLPLPNQSDRTWLERHFFDLKERKFGLNIYRNEFAREAYMRYLARTYPDNQGMPLSEIRWKIYTQGILSPDEAVKQQKLWSDGLQSIDFDDLQVLDASALRRDSELQRGAP